MKTNMENKKKSNFLQILRASILMSALFVAVGFIITFNNGHSLFLYVVWFFIITLTLLVCAYIGRILD